MVNVHETVVSFNTSSWQFGPERLVERTSPGAAPPRVGALGLPWHAALWVALVGLSSVLLLMPSVPVAGRNPLLAVAIGTTAAFVGLALLQLGTLRFLAFGRRVDLFTGAGFGVLALVNLVVTADQVWRAAGLSSRAVAYLFVFGDLLAAVLFVCGLFPPRSALLPAVRRTAMRRTGLGLVLAVTIAFGILAASGSTLPPALDGRAYDLLQNDQGGWIRQSLPGQTAPLLLGNGAAAAFLLVAAVGYVAFSRRLADPQVGWLAAALTLLFFSQLHAFLFPRVALEYVSSADLLRLLAYVLLLFSLVTRLSGEIAERASRDERLRLSRELHDGLAQQLGLLNLRLNRAASPTRSAEARARDLESAKRLVEAASLEARQAITALRTGRVTWEELTRTVGTFTDEFAQNHEIAVQTTARGSALGISAELQAEVLRILHEAFSNAIRHGQATRLEVALDGQAHQLALIVSDNGRGFDPCSPEANAGVGLHSMRERVERRGGSLVVAAAPGQGAALHVRFPL